MTTETPEQQRRSEAQSELACNTMYELLGGESAVTTLVDRFYEIMDGDESFTLIRHMHKTDLSPMRLSLFEFLSGWIGGPPLFIQRHGGACLTGVHAPYAIGHEARDQWLGCMNQAMRDVGVKERYRELLAPAFESMAEAIRNTD